MRERKRERSERGKDERKRDRWERVRGKERERKRVWG